MWSWILEGIGMTGALLAGRKLWWAWSLLLANAILWAVYGITSEQYGFAFASIFYGPIYARNMMKWRKVQIDSEMKNIEDWNLTDLADFFEGFHEIDGPLSDSAASECMDRQNYTDSGTNATPCENGCSDISASATPDVLPTNECNHSEAGLIPNGEGELSVIEFTYCPKCGEKL
jgi:hypothetical protein